MRSEKRKRWIASLLVAILLLSIPIGIFKVLAATRHMSGSVISFYSDCGTITSSDQSVIMDERTSPSNALANLIGDRNGIIANSVYNRYADVLIPSGFNPVIGLSSIEEKQGNTLRTTLLNEYSQGLIAEAFGEYNGVCVAMNVDSGAIICALSLPSSYDTSENAPEGSSFNKVLQGRYVPGSTIKPLTMVVALDQGINLDNFTATCNGSLELPDGTAVNCHGVHGKCDIVRGLGVSCNTYFAALGQQLDLERANETLNNLGFYTTEEHPEKHVDKLWRQASSTKIDSRGFNDTWSLVGQGYSEVSPIDMCLLAGAIGTGNGSVGVPYLVESIWDEEKQVYSYEAEPETVNLIKPEIAEKARSYWRKAYKTYYKDICLGIFMAKTGTAEHGDGTTSRALIGYMEQHRVAFYIYCEGLPGGNKRCQEIAKVLDNQLQLYYP